MNEPNALWNDIIVYGAGLITALGLGKVIPAFLDWWKEWRDERRQLRGDEKKKLNDLLKRVEHLEGEVSKYRNFKTRTDTAFRLMLPVISGVMKDHPNHIALFEQLKNIIFEEVEITPADGHEKL